MKKFFAIIGLLIYCGGVRAQAPDYNDLIILYADGKYEKLITAAQRYTEKESNKMDALPYLWLSKGLYAMSQEGDKDPAFKNAFKDAIAALGNFRKKDKDGSLFLEHIEYVDKIKSAVLESVLNEIDAKSYKKAIPLLTKYYKISPDDVGAKLLEAACKYKDGDKSGATTVWKEVDKKLPTIPNVDTLSVVDKQLFITGVFETAECFINSKQVDRARNLINKVTPWFEEEEEFKTKLAALNL
jgi:hypothetical protein